MLCKCHRKSGVLAMTRSLAVEWGKFRSNAIAPDHSQPKEPGTDYCLEILPKSLIWLKKVPVQRVETIRN
jgi:NAD(P)-dependent dehydrogenase (short-subunit alcohol dehydrogenase family)